MVLATPGSIRVLGIDLKGEETMSAKVEFCDLVGKSPFNGKPETWSVKVLERHPRGLRVEPADGVCVTDYALRRGRLTSIASGICVLTDVETRWDTMTWTNWL